MLDITLARPAEPGTGPALMVAVEVIVLRPPDLATRTEAGPWPVLAIVLDEPNELAEPSVRPLFELLDESARVDRIAVVAARRHWTPPGPTDSLVRLAVQVIAPVRCDLDVILPAGIPLGSTGLLADGPTIALTNRTHANRLPERVHVRDALAELVLLGGSSPGIPSAMAEVT